MWCRTLFSFSLKKLNERSHFLGIGGIEVKIESILKNF